MFFTLFLKECRWMLKCLTYYAVLICIVLFYTTQLGNLPMVNKPEPGQKSYGYYNSEDKTVIMNSTVIGLSREYANNFYVTYPIGFYKKVVLSEEKQSRMGDILSEATGRNKEEFKSVPDNLSASAALTYDQFTKLMTKADKLLGGGSDYAKAKLKNNARVPMTYEQALKEYDNTIKKDRYTGAYARYFSDYMGIILALLPVFIAVTRSLRDRRARASEVIYSREASSSCIILSRYIAIVVMLLLPIILLSLSVGTECIYFGRKAGISVDYLAFIKYILGWLLPTILFTTSAGVFLTELTDSAIAIIVQGIWWIISIFMGMTGLVGNYGWNLVPRHNTIGDYQIFHDGFGVLAANRIVYTLAALALAFGSVAIYDRKRKGRLVIRGKISANRKNKSEI